MALSIAVLSLIAPSTAAALDKPPEGQASFSVVARPLTPNNAPADEYFGRYKLSNLGVRNLIHAFNIEGNSPEAQRLQRVRMDAAYSALVDWSEKYPRDPWLPNAMLGLANVLSQKDDATFSLMGVDLLLRASQLYGGKPAGSSASSRLRATHVVSGIDFSTDTFDASQLGYPPIKAR